VSIRKAIDLWPFSHGGWYAKDQTIDQLALRIRFQEIANARSRFGHQPIDVMLRREG
jgi:hypothetical protein